MMNEQKIMNLLSMAQRAGRVASGDFAVTKAVQGNKVHLLLVAGDASAETRQRYEQMAAQGKIKIVYLWDREQLGHCIGKDFRAVTAVMDAGFANAIARFCPTDGETGVD